MPQALAIMNAAVLESVYSVLGDARAICPASAFAGGDLAAANPHLAASFTAHAIVTSLFPNWQQQTGGGTPLQIQLDTARVPAHPATDDAQPQLVSLRAASPDQASLCLRSGRW